MNNITFLVSVSFSLALFVLALFMLLFKRQVKIVEKTLSVGLTMWVEKLVVITAVTAGAAFSISLVVILFSK